MSKKSQNDHEHKIIFRDKQGPFDRVTCACGARTGETGWGQTAEDMFEIHVDAYATNPLGLKWADPWA